MKVGLIFESGPHGADKQVCEYLLNQIAPENTYLSVTLDNKRKLVIECGRSAANLIVDGCEHVVIVWDLHPPWRETKPCRKEDREDIMRSLKAADVDTGKVFLVCVEEELEAWLIADNRAIEKVLSRPTHPVRINDERRPERVNNPKKRLSQIYQQNGRRYNDLIDAIKIARAMPDLNKIKRCDTFVRFVVKATGKTLDL